MTRLQQRRSSMRLTVIAESLRVEHRGTLMAALLIHLDGVWIHPYSFILNSVRNSCISDGEQRLFCFVCVCVPFRKRNRNV